MGGVSPVVEMVGGNTSTNYEIGGGNNYTKYIYLQDVLRI